MPLLASALSNRMASVPRAPRRFGAGRRAQTVPSHLACLAAGLLALVVAGLPGKLRAQGVFVRGDCDQNLSLQITDPIVVLNFLFLGRRPPPCLDACDFDDDEELNLTDAIFGLGFLFLGGPAPPVPYPSESVDPAGDELDCQNGRIPFEELRLIPGILLFHHVGHSRSLVLRAVRETGEVLELGEEDEVSFWSDDDGVASVDANGLVVATGVGVTFVRARHLIVETRAEVRVLPGADGGPVLRITSPPDRAVVASSVVDVTGFVSAAEAELTLESPETGPITIAPDPADPRRFAAAVPLAVGENPIAVSAETDLGEAGASITVRRVEAGEPGALGPDGRPFPVISVPRVTPPDTTAPALEIASPGAGVSLMSAFVDVAGTVDDPEADIRVNGAPASLDGGEFRLEGLGLRPGDNRIVVTAVDRVGNESSADVTVFVDLTRPAISLEEPAGSLLVTSSTRVRFSGRVRPASSTVTINGVAASVDGTSFDAELEFQEGLHDVVIRAESGGGAHGGAQLVRALLVDRTAPEVEIVYPPPELLFSESGFLTDAESVVVAGRVFDPGAPTEGGGAIRVRVDRGTPIEARGTFAVTVPLEIGANRPVLKAEDARGNAAEWNLSIERSASPSVRAEVVSGDGQSVEAGAAFPEPLVVRVVDELRRPRADAPLTFRVAAGAGSFPGGARRVGMTTDADGQASVLFAAGNRAGRASEVVAVSTSEALRGGAVFVLDTVPAQGRVLAIRGESELTRMASDRVPLAVRLLDGAGNPVAGSEVSFRLEEGAGSFPEGPESARVTDASGLASVEALLAAGDSRATVEAASDGADPVRWRLRGLEAGPPADTAVAGSVLDDRSQPVAGAIVRVVGSGGTASVSDAEGAFFLAGVPFGELLLEVADEAPFGEVSPPGQARFRVTVVAGRRHRLAEPLRLPRRDRGSRRRLLRVGEGSGVVSLPSLPGFRLEAPPGSVLFPDGSRSGVLEAVHPNLRIARGSLPDGVVPAAAVLLLPEGARFGRDVRVTLPNPGIPPGSPVALYEACGAAGAHLRSAGAVVSEDSFSIALPAGSIHRGGLLFVAIPGPPGGRTGDVSGSLALPIPRVTEAPQRPESHVGGFQVYAHSGEFFLDETDLEIPGRGLSYRFRRRYESRHLLRGSLGWNWEHEYADRRLHPGLAGGNIVRADGAGNVDEYLHDPAGGGYVSPVGVFSRLFPDAEGFLVERDPDGTRYRSHPLDGSPLAGRLESITDRMGNRLRMVWSAEGRLEEVRDSLGRPVFYSYDGEGRIERIADFAEREVSFEYDENGDLVAVTGPAVTDTPTDNNFPGGKRTEYVYSSGFGDRRLNHNLLQVIDPRQVALGSRVPRLVNHYREVTSLADVDRVIAQDWGGTNDTGVPAGGRLSIQYVDTPLPSSGAELGSGNLAAFLLGEAGLTRIVDRKGHLHEIRWSGAGLPLSVRIHTEEGLRPRDPKSLHPPPGVAPPWYETRYRWSPDGLLVSVEDPRGSRVEFVRDIEAPLRYGRRQIVEERRYPAPGADGAVGPPEVVRRAHDPLFGRQVLYEPPADGDGDAMRRATRWFLDYQESATLEVLAAEAGVGPDLLAEAFAHAGMELQLGDLNGDGVTSQFMGNRIVERLPDATLPDGNLQEGERLSSFNRFGQVTARRDANGVVTRLEYYPESDPDGDGEPTPGDGLDPGTGGYLKAVVVDTEGFGGREPLGIETRYLYDSLGRLSQVSDPRGGVVFFSHNSLGQLVEYHLPPPLNYRRSFLYDHDDHLVKVRVENYRATDANVQDFVTANFFIESHFEYDLLGQLISATREVSGGEVGPERSLVALFRYDPNGRLVSRSYGDGSSEETWTYDERGLVISHTRGAGSPEASIRTWHRDENGNIVLSVDAEDSDGDGSSETAELRYDGHDRLVAVIDAAGGARVLERRPGGEVISEAFLGRPGGPTPRDGSTDGNVLLASAWMDYDERGRLTRLGRKLFGGGETAQSLIEEYFYDGEGREIRRKLPDGSEETLTRDAAGRIVEERRASGSRVRRDYDANGNPVEELIEEISGDIVIPELAGDPDYDDEGRLRRVDRRIHIYDALDRRIVTIDQNGGTWRARYDSLDNLVFTSDAEGTELTAAADPELAPVLDRLTPLQADSINGHGNRVRYYYDNIGRLVSVEHEMRRNGHGGGSLDTTNGFNFDGLITLSLEWDDSGRLVAWTDDRELRTQIDYDAAGIPLRKTWPDGSSETWESDRDGNPRRVVDRNGSTVVQRFDALHRLVERSIERGSSGGAPVEGTTMQRFELDGLSRVTLFSDNNDPGDLEDDSVVTRRYDSLGRLVEECQDGFCFSFEPDALGRWRALRYPDGRLVETPRGADGEIALLRDERRAYATYSRLSSGRLLEKQLASGIVLSYLDTDEEGATRLRGYDSLGAVVEHSYRGGSGEILMGFEYGRASNGLPLYERYLHRSETPGDVWRYDSIYRIRRYIPETLEPRVPPVDPVRKLEFQHDGSHNWRFVEVDQGLRFIDVNERNQYVFVDADELEYDGRGNLIRAGARRFFYDALDRLVRVVRGETEIARYRYDATGAWETLDYSGRGRRVSKDVRRPVQNQPAGLKRFNYLGERVAEERGDERRLLRQYLYEDGGRPAVLLKHEEGGFAEPFEFLHDARGSTAGLVGAAASLEEQSRYGLHGDVRLLNVFGNPISFTRLGNSLEFGGLVWDFETELHSAGGRYFLPDLGRFLTDAAPFLISDTLAVNGYLWPGFEPLPGEIAGGGRPREPYFAPPPLRKGEVRGRAGLSEGPLALGSGGLEAGGQANSPANSVRLQATFLPRKIRAFLKPSPTGEAD